MTDKNGNLLHFKDIDPKRKQHFCLDNSDLMCELDHFLKFVSIMDSYIFNLQL